MRQGITPVIATVILLMMAVAIAGAAFFWINVVQSRSQAAVGTQVSSTIGRTSAIINLVALKLDVVEDELKLTLHNIGDSNIPSGTIALTIFDEQDYVVKSFSSNLSSNFETNSFLTLNYALNSSLVQNETYKVKVTLPGGVTLTGSASVGGSGFRVISCTSDGDCGSYCVGNVRYYGGSCVSGDCAWSNSQTCAYGCVNGLCGADPCDSLNCDDGNPCTTDSCNEGSCSNVVVSNGTSCSGCTGSLCFCVSGVCESTCGDGNCDAWEDYSNCGLDCPANCQEVQGSCTGVWFTGLITTSDINYCACCDAATDYFYNGSISTTTHFCYQGSYANQEIDANQTICDYYYTWIDNGSGTGAYCCGDDGSTDDFYSGDLNNSINFCLDGSFINQPIDFNQDLCTNWGYDWISNVSSNNLFWDAGFESNSTWSPFIIGAATAYLNDTPGLVYNGTYSLYTETTGGSSDDVALYAQQVASVDYLSFYVNGTIKGVSTGYYGVVVSAGGGVDDSGVKKIFYFVNQSGFDANCGVKPNENTTIICLDRPDDEWQFVQLNPKSDFDSNFASYNDSYFDVYFGTQYNGTAYFDDVRVGELTEFPCCGDDGSSDDFYNSSAYCCNGSLNSGSCFCGDGICQSWESTSSCPTDCVGLFAEDVIALAPVGSGNYIQTDMCVGNIDQADSQPEIMVSIVDDGSSSYTVKAYNYSNQIIELKDSEVVSHSGVVYPYAISCGDLDNDGYMEAVVSGQVKVNGLYNTFIDIFNMSGGKIFMENSTVFNLSNDFAGVVESDGFESVIGDLGNGSKLFVLEEIDFDTSSTYDADYYVYEYTYSGGVVSVTDSIFVQAADTVLYPALYDNLALGDVDGDGSDELAVNGYGYGNVSVIDYSGGLVLKANKEYDNSYSSFDVALGDIQTSSSYDELVTALKHGSNATLEVHDSSGSSFNTLYNTSFKINDLNTYPLSLLVDDIDNDSSNEVLLLSMYGYCPGTLYSGFNYYNYSNNQLNLENEQVIPNLMINGTYYYFSNIGSYFYSDLVSGDVDEDGNTEVLSVGFLSNNPCSLNARYLNAIVVYEYRS